MKTNTLTLKLLRKLKAYGREANHLLIGHVYLHDNPLLKQPLNLMHIKPRLPCHRGKTPGIRDAGWFPNFGGTRSTISRELPLPSTDCVSKQHYLNVINPQVTVRFVKFIVR